MKSFRFLGRSITNNRGSAFVQALVAVGVVGVMIYFLSPTVIKHRAQVTKTASIITARLALHSMVDYTLFGIRQRWCFSQSWLEEPCGASVPPKTVEILSHPRSVERILMKDESVDYLRMLNVPNPEKAPLAKIEQLINISNFSSMHPVYKIVADLKGYTVEFIKVEITRDNRGTIPEYGREVYLKVKVQLLDKQQKLITVGSSRLETTSFIGVYPREVGSFGLLVAGDLRLDRQSASNLGTGGAYIKQHSSRLEMLKYPGLVFESPVFVNGSVHLPRAPSVANEGTDEDTVYTPVTFKDKLVLGGGSVKRDDVEFRPRTAGGELDQFWYNIRQFGGFQKGVDVDGERDLGLDYLSGAAAGGSNPGASLMAQCQALEKAKYELSATNDSKLSGQLLSKSGGKYNYRLGLSKGNLFNPQSKEVDNPSEANWFNRLLKSWDRKGQDRGPVSKFRMTFGNMVVTGELAEDGQVTLEPKIDLRPLERSLERQVSNLEYDVSNAQQRVNQAARDLEQAERNVRYAEDELEAAQRKSPQDKDEVDRARNRLGYARSQRERAKDNLEGAKAQLEKVDKELDASRDQLRTVRTNMGIQPKVVISLKNPIKPGDTDKENTNASFKDLEIAFEHGNLFVNSMGERMPVSFEFEAYDVSYFRGNSLRGWASNNNRGYLTFRPDGGGFDVSQTITDERGSSRGELPAGDPFLNMGKACDTMKNHSAFQGSDWSASFASNSQHSWSFTNKYADRTNVTFAGTDSYNPPGGGGATVAFRVISMARDCVIESSANFVTGFFTCERLIIKPRSTPLRIIGSFIVINGFDIDDSAYRAGIRWSTIYHPMATFELRQAGVLKGQGGLNCQNINRYPVWHPYPSMRDVSNLYKCNSISLRAKADPFRWTAVDPDCGLLPSSNSTMCKNRLVRFFVLEVSRESGI